MCRVARARGPLVRIGPEASRRFVSVAVVVIVSENIDTRGPECVFVCSCLRMCVYRA